MTTYDTGDTILHKSTGIVYDVACRHDEYIYTAGSPSRNIPIAGCELVRKASESERLSALKAMAAVQSRQHRPECARSRLAELAQRSDESSGYGCC
jgi:hypothetical protein